MHDRIATGTAVSVVFLAMVCPLLLLSGDSDRIDDFVTLRSRVLATLDSAPASERVGFRRVAHGGRGWDPHQFDDSEIRRVIRTRGWWRQQSQQVTYLLNDEQVGQANAELLADSLLKLESGGLGQAGLRPLTSGSLHRIADVSTSVAVQVWSDPHHYLTVIVQATLSAGMREAHVSKFLIEQCSTHR